MAGDFDEDQTIEFLRPVSLAEPRHARLLVLSGLSVGRTVDLAPGRLVVGRSRDADLRLDDDGVSRDHCLFLVDAEGVRVRDLGSTNGTWVEEHKLVGERLLNDGDRVRVGPEVILKFGLQDQLEQAFLSALYTSATRDGLTGLANRRAFEDAAAKELTWHRRHQQLISMMLLDLDHFKQVNDTHGHEAGDRVLKATAEAIERTCREEDLVARWGGEEFVVLLRRTGHADASRLAERLRATIAASPVQVLGAKVEVRVSIGVVTHSGQDLAGLEQLFRDADACLYEAKERGRDRVVAR